MRANSFFVLMGAAFLAVMHTSVAQSPTPSPSPQGYLEGSGDAVGDGGGSARKKMGFVRLWVFGGSEQTPIAAYALETPEQTSVQLDHWICRSTPTGFLSSFKEIPAGEYTLHIENDENPQISLKSDGSAQAQIQKKLSLLKSPVAIEIKPQDYQTLLLMKDGDGFKLQVVPETGLPPSQHKLRVLNFSDADAAVGKMNNGKFESMGTIPANQLTDFPAASGGLSNYQVVAVDKKGKTRTFPLEVDHSQSQTASIAIFLDRYGRMAAQPADGAPVGTRAP